MYIITRETAEAYRKDPVRPAGATVPIPGPAQLGSPNGAVPRGGTFILPFSKNVAVENKPAGSEVMAAEEVHKVSPAAIYYSARIGGDMWKAANSRVSSALLAITLTALAPASAQQAKEKQFPEDQKPQ
jgi:hypothetical protein